MNTLLSLVIHTGLATPLSPAGIVALPAAIDTAGHLFTVGDELRVLVNRSGLTETLQYRLPPAQSIEPLPSLPMTVSAAVACAGSVYVTGSDHDGQAIVATLDPDGTIAWAIPLAGPQPIRWPEPVCTTPVLLAWQTEPSALETATPFAGDLAQLTSIPVGGPPVDIVGDGSTLWVASTESPGVRIDRIEQRVKRSIHLETRRPEALAVAPTKGGLLLAMQQGQSISVSSIDADSLAVSAVKTVVAPVVGNLEIIDSRRPVLWLRDIELIEDDEPRWRSLLLAGDAEPVRIDGPVHAICQWGDLVAVLGTTQLHVLRLNEEPVEFNVEP